MKKELEALVAAIDNNRQRLEAIETLKELNVPVEYSFEEILKRPGLYKSTSYIAEYLVFITPGRAANWFFDLDSNKQELLNPRSWNEDTFYEVTISTQPISSRL